MILVVTPVRMQVALVVVVVGCVVVGGGGPVVCSHLDLSRQAVASGTPVAHVRHKGGARSHIVCGGGKEVCGVRLVWARKWYM